MKSFLMHRKVFTRIIAPVRYLKLNPFDIATAQGRSQERYRLAAWAILANFVSAGLGLIALVITVPLTLPYLGEERFGVWMTVSSLAGMLSFMDFGVGNGLINRVAAATAKDDPAHLRFVISHGLMVLLAIGGLVGLAFALLSTIMPWERVIKISDSAAAEEARYAISIFVFIFAVSIPLNGLQKIFQGLQLTWQAHIVRGMGSVLSLVLVYFLTQEKAGVPGLLLATYGVQTAMPLMLVFQLLNKNLLGIPRPDGRNWLTETKSLVGLGGLFLVLQIGTIIGWGSDALIVSSILGAATVTKLAVVQRLFQFVTVPLAIMNAPLWSAYADARARGDRHFIASTLKRSLIVSAIVAGLLSMMLVTLSSPIFKVWTGEVTEIPNTLILLYGIWVVLEASGNAFSMFLNGVEEITAQVITVLLFCAIALPLKFYLLPIYGVGGAVLATIIAYLLAVVMPYAIVFRGRLHRNLA